MNLIEKLKGVFNRMFGNKTIENVLHITPTISSTMREAIELWEQMYTDSAPWLNENVHSTGIPAMIASEKARTATIEMDVKITGDSERAEFIRNEFAKVVNSIRKELEYGIALGGLIVKPYVLMGIDGKYKLEFNFTKACDFYPLSFSAEGNITEAAFIDRIITKDKVFSKVEYHKLEGTRLTVKNIAFELDNKSGNNVTSSLNCDLGTPIMLSAVPAWASLEPEVTIDDIDMLLFAYFKMPEANNIDLDSPLGVSGFSRAVDLIKDADEQYANLLWEFQGGQLAIDVDRTALNPLKDSKGNIKEVLPKLQDRLYRHSLDLGDDNTYNVFSPELRDRSILNGLNNILIKIEDVCALSRGTLSQASYAEARTATELKILKQRSFSANADIQKELENTLKSVISIMERYCDLYDIVPSGDFEVAYKWDDSIIVDKDAERQVDLLDVDKGLLSKVEYRMKWMGETRIQAEEAMKYIEDEKMRYMQIQQSFMGMNNPQTNQPNNAETTSDKSEAQAANDKLVRANESVKISKNASDTE